MNGRLAAEELVANVIQTVYQNRSDLGGVVTVTVLNRNATPVKVRVAVHDNQNSPQVTDYIEYDSEIPGKGHLERTGVAVSTTQYISVRVDDDNCNCVIWGNETGEAVSGTTIGTSFDFTEDSQELAVSYSGESYSQTLSTADQGGTELFNISSGSLPSDLSLNTSTGEITGNVTASTPGSDTVSTFEVSLTNTVNSNLTRYRTFNIIRSWRDGSSIIKAAPSGYYLAQNFGGDLSSGTYWIKSPSMFRPLEMWVDMDEESGGYDFFLVKNDTVYGPNCNTMTLPNIGVEYGLDIVYPRSKNHWRAMSNAVLNNDPTSYRNYFQTCYAITKPTGGGNYTGTIMRDANYYSTGSTDHSVPDGGRWWLRDSTFGEPNGDYSPSAFFGLVQGGYEMPGYPGVYNLGDIGFNDGNASYYLGTNYLLSTNAKP